MAGRIDVHHHFIPPAVLEALDKAGRVPLGWQASAWSPENDRKMCQNLGIATSILSVIPFGGVVFKGAEGARLARQCNEYGKSIGDAQPQQYGFFATLPDLINTELAIQEIRYALDECKADGVALWPFYGEGDHDLGVSGLRAMQR